MEVQEFAERILSSDSLDDKLKRIDEPVTDDSTGPARRITEPIRPEELEFAPRRAAPAMPRPGAFTDSRKRAIAHHIMANHELQACEVMAFVLLAFPDAPREFRRGLVEVIQDEQRHTRMHAERAAALGIRFGELPVNCYIWKKAQDFESLLDYLAGLPLTFEGRNLDHTLEFAEYFSQAGDARSAAVMRKIHRDEIEHVRFGLHWLRQLKPTGQSDWEAYCSHLKWPLRPQKAKGETFNRDVRRATGMSEQFIDQLADAE